MLPGDQDIAVALVALNERLDTGGIISITGRVDLKTQVLSERLDGVTGARSMAI